MVRNSRVWEKLETGKRIIRGLNYRKTLYHSWYYVWRSIHICHKGKEIRRCWRTAPRTLKRKKRIVDFNSALHHSHYSSIRTTPKNQQVTQKIVNRKRSEESRRNQRKT